MRRDSVLGFALGSVLALGAAAAFAQGAAPARVVLPTDRTVLPLPEPKYPPITVLDARNATPPPRFEVAAPAGAPNVLIVLIDDMGFGQSSAFGGPIHMPTVEQLAEGGAPLQRVPHHGALLADALGAAERPQPPREQLRLDRRIRHRLPRADGPAPQQRGARRRDAPPERLQHRRVREVPRDARPGRSALRARSDRWPTRSGFDKFYGFIGGETNQWAPLLYDGMTQVELPARSELPPGDRPDDPRGRLGALPEVADAGQAVLHLLRAGRDPRAAPRAEGVDRQVQGQVRPGLGRASARRRSRARSSSAWCRRTRSSRPSPRPSRTGPR